MDNSLKYVDILKKQYKMPQLINLVCKQLNSIQFVMLSLDIL